ncbi:selenium-dependent molybdenum cofactor biosynthesis protein YqeB [Eubacteriaceae bacterium ES2]|nr:selenium-dependent molybdenum cofactor biosynthesis protein YqeB [Eubacteriaceae bacterium ES2]
MKKINEDPRLVIVRGAGDLASGTIYRLHQCGFQVLGLEVEKPTVIRRTVAYATAVFDGKISVEGLTAVRCETEADICLAFKNGQIPVCVDPEGSLIAKFKPTAVVDAILAKKNLGTKRNMAPIVIGLGPGFSAGEDVHAVIETNRGHNLGRVIYKGEAAKNTGVPGDIAGHTYDRVVRASGEGTIHLIKEIGEIVEAGECLAVIGNDEVTAQISGVLRGIIADESFVFKGMKIADIDPRGKREYCWTISDKARNLSGGVLEAIMHLLMQ